MVELEKIDKSTTQAGDLTLSKLNRPEVSKNINSTMNSLDLLDIHWTSNPTNNIFLNIEGTFIKVEHRNFNILINPNGKEKKSWLHACL